MKTGNHSTISNLQASSVGGLVLLLMLAGAINVVAAPKIVTSFPIPSSSPWQGADDPSLHGVYGDMIEALLPVAIVCVVSLLCMAVWLLAAGGYAQRRR
jgi:hypothetical protein